jgi:hypothetical protein
MHNYVWLPLGGTPSKVEIRSNESALENKFKVYAYTHKILYIVLLTHLLLTNYAKTASVAGLCSLSLSAPLLVK